MSNSKKYIYTGGERKNRKIDVSRTWDFWRSGVFGVFGGGFLGFLLPIGLVLIYQFIG